MFCCCISRKSISPRPFANLVLPPLPICASRIDTAPFCRCVYLHLSGFRSTIVVLVAVGIVLLRTQHQSTALDNVLCASWGAWRAGIQSGCPGNRVRRQLWGCVLQVDVIQRGWKLKQHIPSPRVGWKVYQLCSSWNKKGKHVFLKFVA